MGVSARRLRRASSKRGPSGISINIASNKTFASSAGEISGNGVSSLTDGNASTRWISNVQSPATITLDAGGAFDLTSTAITWAADTTKNYTVQASLDNSTWTTLTTGVTSGTSEAQKITHAINGKYRYFRITMNDMWNASYGNSIYEVEVYGVVDASYPIGTISNLAAVVDVAAPKVTLNWNYSGGTLSNYIVTRNGTTVATITNQSTQTYTDTNVTVGQSYTYGVTGTFQTGGATTNTATVSANVSTGSRVAKYHPFTSDSVWNLPIVPNVATYDMPAMRTNSTGQFYANYQQYSHAAYMATNSDPKVTCSDVWGGSVSWWLPAAAAPSAGTDKHLEIISPDGKQILEMFAATINGGRASVSCRNAIVVDLYGNGIGPRKGVRAYGGSAIGGLIREYDIEQGVIKHALALAIDMSSQLGKSSPSTWDGTDYYWDTSVTNSKQPGWNPGRPRYGFGQKLGYVWPATEEDYFADQSNRYNGNVPMGAYFCIPTSVNINSLGLNSQGLMVAKALQDYGAYVTDATEGSAFYVEYRNGRPSSMDSWVSAFNGNNQPYKLFAAMRRVTLNDENNPNGGPLNHPSRPPRIADLAP